MVGGKKGGEVGGSKERKNDAARKLAFLLKNLTVIRSHKLFCELGERHRGEAGHSSRAEPCEPSDLPVSSSSLPPKPSSQLDAADVSSPRSAATLDFALCSPPSSTPPRKEIGRRPTLAAWIHRHDQCYRILPIICKEAHPHGRSSVISKR